MTRMYKLYPPSHFANKNAKERLTVTVKRSTKHAILMFNVDYLMSII